jgi:hypothetical protein
MSQFAGLSKLNTYSVRQRAAEASVPGSGLPTITGISPPSITESPQLMGLGVSSLTSAD